SSTRVSAILRTASAMMPVVVTTLMRPLSGALPSPSPQPAASIRNRRTPMERIVFIIPGWERLIFGRPAWARSTGRHHRKPGAAQDKRPAGRRIEALAPGESGLGQQFRKLAIGID